MKNMLDILGTDRMIEDMEKRRAERWHTLVPFNSSFDKWTTSFFGDEDPIDEILNREHIHYTEDDDANTASFEFNVAGLQKKDIKLTFSDGFIKVRGDDGSHSFSYEVLAPKGYRFDDAKAKLDNGLLTVTADRATEQTTPHEIEIA